MNGRRRLLAASVTSIHDSSFLYPACQNCFSRLMQVSQRYDCHKCGCTSEAKNVKYRYKLSVRVADGTELVNIAVFGSCLDAYFGITSDALQRYIEDLCEGSGEHKRDTAQTLLFQAAEYCFVGRSFIFGVKTFENKAEQLSLSCSSLLTSNRHEKSLVACQISVPNLGSVGCTVISYYNRLLETAAFRNFQGASPFPDSAVTAVEQPSSELSSLYSSGDNQVRPSGRDSLLMPWQLSFGLTSSSVDCATTEEFSAAEESNVFINQSWGAKTSAARTSSSQPIGALQSLGSRTQRGSGEKKLEKHMNCESSCHVSRSDLVSTNSARIKIPNKLDNTSSPVTGSFDNHASSPLQSIPEWVNASFKPKCTYRPAGGLETSWSSAGCANWDKELGSPYLPFKGINVTGSDEEDPAVWDDMPFSESLNEFIARVENGRSTTAQDDCEASPSESTNDFKAKPAYPLTGWRRASVEPHPGCSTWRLPLQHANSHRPVLPSCLSLGSTVKEQVAESNNLSKHLQMGAERGSKLGSSCFSSHLSPNCEFVTSSPSRNHILHSRVRILKAQSSTSLTDSQSAEKHVERLYLPTGSKSAQLHSVNLQQCSVNDVSVVEAKRHFGDSSKENASLTGRQEWGLDSKTHYKEKSENNQLKLVTESQEIAHQSLLQDSSDNSSQNSYNGSVDLFEASDEELNINLESLHRPKDSISPRTALDGKCTVLLSDDLDSSESPRRAATEDPNCIISKNICLPVLYSQTDSDQEHVHSQDFVPYSQSTPVARKLPQLGSFQGKESSVKTQTYSSSIISKCGQSRLPLQGSVLKPPTGNCIKRKSSGKLCIAKGTKNSYTAQHAFCPFSPATDLCESDSEEWIPSSATKCQPPMFPKSRVPIMQTRTVKNPVVCSAIDKKLTFQNKENCSKQKINEYSISSEQKFTNEHPSSTLMHTERSANCTSVGNGVGSIKPLASWTPSFLEKTNYFSVPAADGFSYSEGQMDDWASNWSPELFAEKSIVSQHCGLLQKQLF